MLAHLVASGYSETVIISDRHGPVLNISLNRPEVRNALDETTIAELTEAFLNLPVDVRAVVLRGSGPGFCAGGDLEWMRRAIGFSEEENIADALKLAKLFQAISDCSAITIAVAHGGTFGGGCGLLASVDLAIGTINSQFSFSEVKLGLIPATISPFVINRIGKGNAKWLFATGELFGADIALRIGLVHELVDEPEVDSAIQKKIKAVLSAGPIAVKLAKQLVDDYPLGQEETASRLAKIRVSPEAQEGTSAFLEKRRPSFSLSWPPKV